MKNESRARCDWPNSWRTRVPLFSRPGLLRTLRLADLRHRSRRRFPRACMSRVTLRTRYHESRPYSDHSESGHGCTQNARVRLHIIAKSMFISYTRGMKLPEAGRAREERSKFPSDRASLPILAQDILPPGAPSNSGAIVKGQC